MHSSLIAVRLCPPRRLLLAAYAGYSAAASASASAIPVDLFARVAQRAPVSVGLVALPGLIMLCVAPLACYHCTLVCANKTTSEEIKDVRATLASDEPEPEHEAHLA